MEGIGALQGVRVIDFTWVVAGPCCTAILADQGAEVIKVERRPVTAIQQAYMRQRFDFMGNLSRNKYSVGLNLADARGLEVVKRLISISDVVIENFSSRVMPNWGLDYENMTKINPDIIYVSMAGMGHTGPLKDYVTYGPTLQALSGFNLLTGFPERGPVGNSYSYADMAGGYTGAMAVLLALRHKRKTGRGQYVDLAQFEGTCALIGTPFLNYTVNGTIPQRLGNQSLNAPAACHNVYRCQGEDRWCVISVFSDAEWDAFSSVLSNSSWVKEARFATLANRIANAGELDRLVEEWTIERSPEEVMELMQGAGVAAGVVQNGEDIVARDPQLQARGYWIEGTTAEGEKGSYVGIPFKLSENPGRLRRLAPLLGEQNNYVFGELLGMSELEVAKYTEEGVFFSGLDSSDEPEL